MKNYLKNYIADNIRNIFVILFCIILGLVIGVILVNTSTPTFKEEMINTVKETLNITKNSNFEGINIIYNGITSNVAILIFIYFSALTLIPKLLINGLSILKGIAIGTYIPILFSVLGFGNGLIVCIMLVILPNIIYLPSYIYLCNNALLLHYKIMNGSAKAYNFCIELLKIFISFSVIFLSIIVEQIVVMVIISNYIL